MLGVLLTLLGAHFYPLPEAPRYPSGASALANGGREEAFYIRLPGDRLGSPRAAAVAAFPEPAFAGDGASRIVAELFRVRDEEGRVIGLASKMTGDVAMSADRERENVDWMVLIPSRGALLVSSEGRSADETRSYPTGRMGLSLVNSGFIIEGTREFADLTGFVSAETEVEHVDENGQVHGTLQLLVRMMGNSG